MIGHCRLMNEADTEATLARWPADALAAQSLDEGSCVVALTHDEKIDNPALAVALRSPARYVGALGSRKTHAKRVDRLKAGNGLEDGTQMGPMANPRRPDAMERLIGNARDKGANLDAGGERIGNQGFFYAPSVLSEIPLDADIMNEEPFGPVALINPYRDEASMIAEANRLPYGLAAFSWTNDVQRQRRLADELESGMVGINSHMIGGADSPFGGVKWSGHGAEDGPEGILACMVTKAVHEG